MTYGITSHVIRKLTENPWHGGCGYSYEQVASMTPDQIYHRLCDEKVLKSKDGHRTASAEPLAVSPGPDGMVKGRAADGTPIQGRIAGKSKARQLMEQQQKERAGGN